MKNQDIEEAYSEYESRLYDYAYSMLNNHHDARDVVQSAFLDFANHQHVRNNISFLKSVVKRRANSLLKMAALRNIQPIDSFDYIVAPTKDKEINVYDFMEALSPLQEAIILFYLQGMNTTDIGRIMGISGKTIGNTMATSLRAMKKAITAQADLLGI